MNALSALRLASLAEGASLLALLLVAMPLKYALELPGAVRLVGGIHGLLFLCLLSALVRANSELRWPAGRSLRILFLATVPLGFVVVDRELRRESVTGPIPRDRFGS